jgi:hypothetical protein
MKIKDLKLDENANITRFLYKPGWSIKFAYREDCNEYEMRIMHRDQPDASKFKTIEAYNNYERNSLTFEFDKTPVMQRATLSPEYFKNMKEEDFWEFLFRNIKQIEMHEVTEWFKIDGLYFKNPHPGDFLPGISASECFNVLKA